MDIKENFVKITNPYIKNAEIEPSIDSSNTKNLFDKYFYGQEHINADTDKNGHISIEEAKAFVIENQDNTEYNSIILRIASFLGIETTATGPYIGNSKFIHSITSTLDILKKLDTNNDNDVTLKEILSPDNVYANLRAEDKSQINRIFGIVDHSINNKQGNKGNCYLLTATQGVAKNVPENFKKIIQQDQKGNITVTFFGAHEEPYRVKIPNGIVKFLQSTRTREINNAKVYGTDQKMYGSSDTETIAIEFAFEKYKENINDKQQDYKKQVKKYIDNSSAIMVVKPNIENLNIDNITEEDVNLINNYLRNSKSNTGKAVINKKFSFNGITQELLEQIKIYIKNSYPIQPEKPKNLSHQESVANWIRNSVSTDDNINKPEVKIFPYLPKGEAGWGTEKGIQLLTGGEIQEYNFNQKDLEKINKILENFEQSKNNNQIYSLDFRQDDDVVLKKHAYIIESVDKDQITLYESHDSNKKITYKMDKFLKNCKHLSINTVPNLE